MIFESLIIEHSNKWVFRVVVSLYWFHWIIDMIWRYSCVCIRAYCMASIMVMIRQDSPSTRGWMGCHLHTYSSVVCVLAFDHMNSFGFCYLNTFIFRLPHFSYTPQSNIGCTHIVAILRVVYDSISLMMYLSIWCSNTSYAIVEGYVCLSCKLARWVT